MGGNEDKEHFVGGKCSTKWQLTEKNKQKRTK